MRDSSVCYHYEDALPGHCARQGVVFGSVRSITMTNHQTTTTRTRHSRVDRTLKEALAPYIDLPRLRRLAADGDALHAALRPGTTPPTEVLLLLDALVAILRPSHHETLRNPEDAAAYLMADMGHLAQEHLRVLCLNTKGQVLHVHDVYVGSVNSACIRVGEVFRTAIALNSVAILLAHNHPSGTSAEPSPEDVLVTKQIIDAGRLLDIGVIDHLVVCQGRWVSLKQRGLAFGT